MVKNGDSPTQFQGNTRGAFNRSRLLEFKNGTSNNPNVATLLQSARMGKYWTLWTVREPVLVDLFGYMKRDFLTNSPARIQMSKKEAVELLEQAMMGNGPKYFGGTETDFIAVQPKDLGLEGFPRENENILMGQNFFYNHRIERLEMDVQEIVFHPSGKASRKTNPSVINLSAYRGLAQILAASVKKDDILFISGSTPFLSKSDDVFRKLELNGARNPNDEIEGREHVEIIRICFDVPPTLEIALIERIRPWRDMFEFKYTSSSGANLSMEIVRFRDFNLGMGPHKLDSDIFPMPITREGNPTEAFYILMGGSKKRKPVSPKIPGYRTSLIRTNNYSKREPLDDADDDTENDSYYSTASETSFHSSRFPIFFFESSDGFIRRIFEFLLVFLMSMSLILVAYYLFGNFFPIRICNGTEDGDLDFLDFRDATPAPAPEPPKYDLKLNIPPVRMDENPDTFWY